MSDFDDNEIDKAFRANFEGRGMNVPPSVWANVRAMALERQLIQVKTVNTWLKGLSGLLGAGLALTLYFLGSQSAKTPTSVSSQPKTDTIYLTRTDGGLRVSHDSERATQPKTPETEPVNPIPTTKSTAYTQKSTSSLPEPKIASTHTDVSTDYPATGSGDQRFPLPASVPTPGATSSKRAATNSSNPELPGHTLLVSDKLPTHEREPQGRQYRSDGRALVAQRYPLATPSLPTQNAGSLTTTAPASEPIAMDRQQRAIMPLVALSTYGHPQFRLPTIPSLSTPSHAQASKPTVLRLSPLNKLSLSAYYSPEGAAFDDKHDGHQGNLHDESNHQISQTIGLRVGLRITPNWQLLTGLEYNRLAFDNHRDTESLTAELVNGTPAFTYPTAFGTAVLPNSQLAFTPKAGDVISIDNQTDKRASLWRVPLAVRYNFWTKTGRASSAHPLRFRVYGLLGGAFTMPQRQEIRLLVTGPNLITTSVRVMANTGWKSAVTFQTGVGVSLSFGQHVGFFVEPTYGQVLTHFGSTQSDTEKPGYFGVRLGAGYQFGH